MKMGVHIVLWLFVGAALVLIIKNASSFATAVTAVDTPILQGANLLAGGQQQAASVAKVGGGAKSS